MLKNLLTCLLCLHGYAIFCQQDTANNPGTAQSVTDSTVNTIYDFACTGNGNVILLSWKMLAGKTDYFSIERSCNGKEFEVVAIIKPQNLESAATWTDEMPAKGKNTYRIRCTLKTQQVIESAIATASVVGVIPFRFYPNPVDQVFILRSEEPVDLQISDATGKVRMTISQIQGLRMINVSSLEKGIYMLKILSLQSNAIQQERLVKN